MEKDIKQLVDKFLSGETTLEEEEMLAKYFAKTPALTSKEQALKQMFAWFDEGMPTGTIPETTDTQFQQATIKAYHATKKIRLKWLWTSIATVAATIMAIFMLHYRPNEPTYTAPQQPMKPTTVAALPTFQPDTMATDSATAEPKVRTRKRTLKKYRYQLAPPEVLLAENEADSIIQSNNKQVDKLLENIVAEQQSYLDSIQERYNMKLQNINNMIASMDDEEDIPETY